MVTSKILEDGLKLELPIEARVEFLG